MRQTRFTFIKAVSAILVSVLIALPVPAASAPTLQQIDDPNPPDHAVKLIFIHHSTGENWLRDDYGGLGQALADNNYFVSDTNYGWGPDSIGDRTDIPNWTEWFSSGQTPIYTSAVFNESGQNSSYTRLPDDPGGENQIIMFKSCFPNSALEGSPDDPHSGEEGLTVGHAKYVYNQILQYFATRPDKLFIVITAPPLTDPTYAVNARAFNQWLMNDWLVTNNYILPNVAVFDFYNVLTGPDNHHRFANSQVEHVFTPGMNTEYYPSSDDHPSEAGSRKATEEFLPILNIFYHRWQAGNAQLPPGNEPGGNALPTKTPAVAAAPESGGAGSPLPPENVLSIDDFESGANGWTAFWDEATTTTTSCGAEQGTGNNGSTSLRIDFSVAPGSSATCALLFDTAQDWSAGEWLAYDIHYEKEYQPFSVIVYGGTPNNRETYIDKNVTAYVYEEYITFTSMWNELLRAEWEDKPGTPFSQPGQVTGLAFGFDAAPDAPYTGTIWIDDIRLQKSPTYPTANPIKLPISRLPCVQAILFPLIVMGAFLVLRRK